MSNIIKKNNPNIIIDNIKQLYSQYGEVVNDDKKLLLLYWQQIDKVKMDKQYIATQDFIDKATHPRDILNCKIMFDILKKSRSDFNE